MEGFLKTLLIILLIFFGLRILARLLMPLLLKYIAKKANEKMGGVFSQFQQAQREHPNNAKRSATQMNKETEKVVGEYIDFEEVKE